MTTHVNVGVWAIRRDNGGRAGFDWPLEKDTTAMSNSAVRGMRQG